VGVAWYQSRWRTFASSRPVRTIDPETSARPREPASVGAILARHDGTVKRQAEQELRI